MSGKVFFEHYCEAPGCKAWGSFGYDADMLKGVRGRWYCLKHRPDAGGPTQLPHIKPPPARQGSLL